ncbi:UNVERIFIED_CONTAM: hypothetical protein FKN15_074768 [Acipenser sinensis]
MRAPRYRSTRGSYEIVPTLTVRSRTWSARSMHQRDIRAKATVGQSVVDRENCGRIDREEHTVCLQGTTHRGGRAYTVDEVYSTVRMRQGLAPWRKARLEESLNSGDAARPNPVEELCTLKKEIDNHSQVTSQTRETDNKELPTTQARRLLKDRKAKGEVFSESLIPGKRRASFQHECKGNTIDSIRLEKFFSINMLSSTQRSYRTIVRRKKRNGFLRMTVFIPR